ncbi:hypothetical protein JOD82_002221 [Paenibacillus sp. 1182]|uniref:hypothetical protein n=1 Tax=Paenibacillus sp. 1182 TaxID=2806565 RepID=UPI001AE83FF6|nr:hypothetical protein [Paenibacillus sp. 1182]MBP1309201.1 hypothetical protein [Paenibacillus sp. 1182]
MFWYHGTTQRRQKSILNSDFQLGKGLWGTGLYLTSSKEAAHIFGDAILKVSVDESKVSTIDFEDFIEKYPLEETWSKVIAAMNFKALVISYITGEKELCIFDTEIIKEIQY